MDTYQQIIKLLREATEELKDDNDAYDNRKETQVKTNEEKENDWFFNLLWDVRFSSMYRVCNRRNFSWPFWMGVIMKKLIIGLALLFATTAYAYTCTTNCWRDAAGGLHCTQTCF